MLEPVKISFIKSGHYDCFNWQLSQLKTIVKQGVPESDSSCKIEKLSFTIDKIGDDFFQSLFNCCFRVIIPSGTCLFNAEIISDYMSHDDMSHMFDSCVEYIQEYMNNVDNKPVSTSDFLTLIFQCITKRFNSDIRLTTCDCGLWIDYQTFMTFDVDRSYDTESNCGYVHVSNKHLIEFFNAMCLYEKKPCKYSVKPVFTECVKDCYPARCFDVYYKKSITNPVIRIINTTILKPVDWYYQLIDDTVRINDSRYVMGYICEVNND